MASPRKRAPAAAPAKRQAAPTMTPDAVGRPVDPFPRSPAGQLDAATPLPPKPCSARHPDGDRWCYLPEHQGDHAYPPPRELPRNEHMPREAPR